MRRTVLPLVVVALAVAYPLAVLAGGTPKFPSRDDCVRPAIAGAPIDAVFGYFETEGDAVAMRDRAIAAGFKGTASTWNGCGRVRVAVGGIPTLEVGRDFVAEARGAGFDVTLEQAG